LCTSGDRDSECLWSVMCLLLACLDLLDASYDADESDLGALAPDLASPFWDDDGLEPSTLVSLLLNPRDAIIFKCFVLSSQAFLALAFLSTRCTHLYVYAARMPVDKSKRSALNHRKFGTKSFCRIRIERPFNSRRRDKSEFSNRANAP
jgi:hypothetical protein